VQHKRVGILSAATFAAGIFAATLALGAEVTGDQPKVQPPGGENLEMSKHFTGSVGETGQFPGTLVCLRSKESFVPLSAEDCAGGERVYALEMKDDKAMHPIKAGGDEVETQLHQLLGKPVLVTGLFQSSTGLLIASSVQERQEKPS